MDNRVRTSVEQEPSRLTLKLLAHFPVRCLRPPRTLERLYIPKPFRRSLSHQSPCNRPCEKATHLVESDRKVLLIVIRRNPLPGQNRTAMQAPERPEEVQPLHAFLIGHRLHIVHQSPAFRCRRLAIVCQMQTAKAGKPVQSHQRPVNRRRRRHTWQPDFRKRRPRHVPASGDISSCPSPPVSSRGDACPQPSRGRIPTLQSRKSCPESHGR